MHTLIDSTANKGRNASNGYARKLHSMYCGRKPRGGRLFVMSLQ